MHRSSLGEHQLKCCKKAGDFISEILWHHVSGAFSEGAQQEVTGARKSFALEVKRLGLQSWDYNVLLRSQSCPKNMLGILQSRCVLSSLSEQRNKVTGWFICGKQTLFHWPVRLPFCRQRRKVSAISWFCSPYLKAVGMHVPKESIREEILLLLKRKVRLFQNIWGHFHASSAHRPNWRRFPGAQLHWGQWKSPMLGIS